GVLDVRPIGELASSLAGLLASAGAVGWRVGRSPRADAMLVDALGAGLRERVLAAAEVQHLAAAYRRTNAGLPAICDPRDAIGELRRVKSAEELGTIRRAASATARAYRGVAESASAGASGRVLAARLDAAMVEGGAAGTGFAPIVALAGRTTRVRARPFARAVEGGSLVLVDAGAEVDGYASDLSRVFGVGGLPARAAALYDLVLAAQLAAIDAVRPGASLDDVHAAALAEFDANLGAIGLPV